MMAIRLPMSVGVAARPWVPCQENYNAPPPCPSPRSRMAKDKRFAQLTMDTLDAGQKPLGEQIMKVSSVGLAGPYNPLLRSAVLGQRMYDLLYYLRWNTSV